MLWAGWRLVHHPRLGSLAPALGNTGLASPFSGRHVSFASSRLLSKAKGFQMGSPAKNKLKKLSSRLSQQFSMEPAAPTAVKPI